MKEKQAQDRDVLEKLGIHAGDAVVFANALEELDANLSQRVLARTGRTAASEGEALDMVLATIRETDEPVPLLKHWRSRLKPSGSIWLLTAKRGQPGYVDQRELIAAGQQAEMVDNKICSISATVSAMRFVIRKKDRQG